MRLTQTGKLSRRIWFGIAELHFSHATLKHFKYGFAQIRFIKHVVHGGNQGIIWKEARGPLLAIPNRIDGSLAEQVAAMQAAAPKEDDLASAQAKVSRLIFSNGANSL